MYNEIDHDAPDRKHGSEVFIAVAVFIHGIIDFDFRRHFMLNPVEFIVFPEVALFCSVIAIRNLRLSEFIYSSVAVILQRGNLKTDFFQRTDRGMQDKRPGKLLLLFICVILVRITIFHIRKNIDELIRFLRTHIKILKRILAFLRKKFFRPAKLAVIELIDFLKFFF